MQAELELLELEAVEEAVVVVEEEEVKEETDPAVAFLKE